MHKQVLDLNVLTATVLKREVVDKQMDRVRGGNEAKLRVDLVCRVLTSQRVIVVTNRSVKARGAYLYLLKLQPCGRN